MEPDYTSNQPPTPTVPVLTCRMLSLAPMRVKMPSSTVMVTASAGTQLPTCSMQHAGVGTELHSSHYETN